MEDNALGLLTQVPNNASRPTPPVVTELSQNITQATVVRPSTGINRNTNPFSVKMLTTLEEMWKIMSWSY